MPQLVDNSPAATVPVPAKRHRSVAWILAGLTLIYLVLAVASALTQRPWCDEAWNSSPALCLITRGYMGTPALETAGSWTTGIDRYTYWIMPLHPVTQAAWYTVTGFSVFSVRSYSMFWGVVALFSWFVIVRRLTGDTTPALITFGLLATDFIFIQRSSEGRMDILSAALGFLGLAVYLTLRERRFTLAVVLSNACICASCLSHPNGVMPMLALAFVTLYFDWRQIRPRHIVLAAVPYIIGLSAWGLYIMQAPDLARTQLSGNASGRFRGVLQPLQALRNEVFGRILPYMGGIGQGLSTVHRVKAIVLAVYVGGVIAALVIPQIRSGRAGRILLVLTAIYFSFLTWLEGSKNMLYLVHIVPVYLATLGVVTGWMWRHRPAWRLPIAGAAVVFLGIQISGTAFVVKRDYYGTAYRPVVKFLKERGAGRGAHVMGSAELGFELGFFENLTDDVMLGLNSGKKPDLIVVDKRYTGWIELFQKRNQRVYDFIQHRLTVEYSPVYKQGEYIVFSRR